MIPSSLKSGPWFHGVVWKGWASRAGGWVLFFSASGRSEVSTLLVWESSGWLISTEAEQLAVALTCEDQINVGKRKRRELRSLLGACWRDTSPTHWMQVLFPSPCWSLVPRPPLRIMAKTAVGWAIWPSLELFCCGWWTDVTNFSNLGRDQTDAHPPSVLVCVLLICPWQWHRDTCTHTQTYTRSHTHARTNAYRHAHTQTWLWFAPAPWVMT